MRRKMSGSNDSATTVILVSLVVERRLSSSRSRPSLTRLHEGKNFVAMKHPELPRACVMFCWWNRPSHTAPSQSACVRPHPFRRHRTTNSDRHASHSVKKKLPTWSTPGPDELGLADRHLCAGGVTQLFDVAAALADHPAHRSFRHEHPGQPWTHGDSVMRSMCRDVFRCPSVMVLFVNRNALRCSPLLCCPVVPCEATSSPHLPAYLKDALRSSHKPFSKNHQMMPVLFARR